MQCLFLFRDSSGRLPTAQDLRRCGFLVSEAALPATDAGDADGPPSQPFAWSEIRAEAPGLALAAEPKPAYGAGPKSLRDGELPAARDEAGAARAGAGA